MVSILVQYESSRALTLWPRFIGSTAPSVKGRPLTGAPSQKALVDSGAPRFRCFSSISRKPEWRSLQTVMHTTVEHTGASNGKVHPSVNVPAPASAREAVDLHACFQPHPLAASRFDAVAP